jgi:hypothetical protein
MKKTEYTITAATMTLALKALSRHQTGGDGDEDYNNNDVIEALDALEGEVTAQDEA